MNNDFLKNIGREAKKFQLDPAEKGAVRENIRLFMNANPISPKTNLVHSFFNRFKPVYLGLPVLVLLGGSVSFAAENSLPGDFLYPVKTNINENVMRFAAFSPQQKAQVEATLAQRRMNEAGELNAKNELTPEIKSQLSADFKTHISNADEAMDNVPDSDTQFKDDIDTDITDAIQSNQQLMPVFDINKDRFEKHMQENRKKNDKHVDENASQTQQTETQSTTQTTVDENSNSNDQNNQKDHKSERHDQPDFTPFKLRSLLNQQDEGDDNHQQNLNEIGLTTEIRSFRHQRD